MPMTNDPLTHHRTLPFGQSLHILDNGHSGFAHDHKDDATLMHPPQIVSVQVPSINHDGANVRMLSQVALGLREQRDQSTPLILLDFDQFHGQGQARLDLNEHQHFPPIEVIFLRRRFLLSFDFHPARLLELPAPLIALKSRQFASIQGDHELAGKHSPPGEQLHHLVKKSLHLLLAEFADVVGQTLGSEWPLLLFRFALAISSFGQPVFALLGIKPHQLHQRQITKEYAREVIHRFAAKEHLEEIEQDKLHGGNQYSLHSWEADLFKGTQDAHFLQKHKKFIQQPCIAEFMHFLNCFSCIQSLRHLGIISARQLPVESFLDHAGSFCVFVCSCFALHAVRSSSLLAFPSAYHFPFLPTTLIPERQFSEKNLDNKVYHKDSCKM